MTGPRLSVVMSVFNGERYLAAALESILRQSFSDFELVAIDDGSTDGSAGILRGCADPRLNVLTNGTNIGLTRSLNRGLAAARGAYVARQDADDLSHPSRFARQVAFLDASPEVALVGSCVRIIDADGRVRSEREARPSTPAGVRWQLLFGNPFAHSSVMFRRAVVWGELGGYDESCEFNQDFELWSRLDVRHGATNLPEPLIDYRAHASSIVGRRDERARESRLTNVARNIEIQRRNIRRILGREDLAEVWPPLWTSLNVEWLTGQSPSPERAIDLLGSLYDEFCRRYPGAAGDADVARGRATVLVKIACELARTNRLAACAAYRAALAVSPAVGWTWAAPVAARLILGQRGERAVRRVRALWRRA